MRLVYGLPRAQDFKEGAAITIGNFDGVHIGHQALISQLIAKAQACKILSVVILFEPQPAEYFAKNKAPNRLFSLREKIIRLKECGVEVVCCLKFDQALACMSATEFAMKLLTTFRPHYLLVGKDFRFGSQREGNLDFLHTIFEKNSCQVEAFKEHLYQSERVSSTLIRQALSQLDFEKAATLLGTPYTLCGRVVKGAQRGRQWGIPTANLLLSKKHMPLMGIFCVKVKKGNLWHNGVANLGTRPTIDGKKAILEVHLLEEQTDFYGEFIFVCFLHKLRDEIKFNQVDDLISQIQDDIEQTRKFFLGTA
jgi:riboflavin kinase/FMN adenylyltransferase